MGAPELLPCPFCGGTPRFMIVPPLHHHMRCDGCGARTADGGVELAFSLWNRRSDRAGLLAGLRECAELADQWSEARLDEANAPIISGDVFTDGGVFVQSTADANAGYRLMDFAKSIRARIAALETEEGKP